MAEMAIHQAAIVNLSGLYIILPSIDTIIPTIPKTSDVNVMPFGMRYLEFYILYL
jgi:hypothetical protein